MIPISKPYLTKEEAQQAYDTILSGWITQGPKVSEFEKNIADYVGTKYAVAVSNCTTALHLAMLVSEITSGDEVICPSLSYIATANAIKYVNAIPVFAEINPISYNLDIEDVERKITAKTKAILFVGIGGNIGQYDSILEYCNQQGFKLILDAAHMAGTKVDKIHHGSIITKQQVGWDADVTIFSFQAVKNLPTADSGMICFQNKDYDSLARKLSWLGIDKDTFKRTNEKGNYKWVYDVIDYGFKAHSNSIMASMGLVGLKYLDEDNSRRREICELYDKGLSSNPKIKIIKHNPKCESSRHLYQIQVKNRDNILEYLNNNNIFPGVHYKDNTQYEVYSYGFGTCPNSHKASNELISLPLHLFLTSKEIEYVIEKVNEAVKIWN